MKVVVKDDNQPYISQIRIPYYPVDSNYDPHLTDLKISTLIELCPECQKKVKDFLKGDIK